MRKIGAAASKERLWTMPAAPVNLVPAIMKISQTSIPDVLTLEPKVYGDDRWVFTESYTQQWFSKAIGCEINFVQDNELVPKQAVLRGLYYLLFRPQRKLACVS